MNGENKPTAKPEERPAQPPPPPPIPPNDAAVLGGTEGNPSSDAAAETAELVRETRVIEILQFAVNAILAVIGIVALCIYGGQLRVMKGQLAEIIRQYPQLEKSARASADSATAAKDGVKAANDSVDAIKRQMRQDQRAWVKVEPRGNPVAGGDPTNPQFNLQLSSAEPVVIPIRIMNTGKTPAIDIDADVFIDIVDVDKDPFLPNPNKVLKPGEPVPSSRYRRVASNHVTAGIIFPGTHTEAVAKQARIGKNGKPEVDPIGIERAKKMQAEKAFIVIYGWVNYSDVFGVKHWTRFCKSLGPDSGERSKCPQYNRVDNN